MTSTSPTSPPAPPPDRLPPGVVGRASADLLYLGESWPALVMLKIPGTPRSWVERPRRTGVLTDADVERMGPQGVPRPAPADVSVIDLLSRIETLADDLVRTLRSVVDDLTGLPEPSAFHDPRPWFDRARELLPAAHDADPRSGPWCADQVRPLAQKTARLLGDVRDGQVLDGVCPWCGGLTERGSGERTMQVRYPDARAVEDEPLIVCRGLGCSPPSQACGTRHDGRPAWPTREWDWLAKQLRAS